MTAASCPLNGFYAPPSPPPLKMCNRLLYCEQKSRLLCPSQASKSFRVLLCPSTSFLVLLHPSAVFFLCLPQLYSALPHFLSIYPFSVSQLSPFFLNILEHFDKLFQCLAYFHSINHKASTLLLSWNPSKTVLVIFQNNANDFNKKADGFKRHTFLKGTVYTCL